MNLIPRQTPDVDDSGITDLGTSDTGAPSPAAVDLTAVAQIVAGPTAPVPEATDVASGATDPAVSPGVTDVNTDAPSSVDPAAPPAAQTIPSSGASDAVDPTVSSTDPAQTTELGTSSLLDPTQTDATIPTGPSSEVVSTAVALGTTSSDSAAVTSSIPESSATLFTSTVTPATSTLMSLTESESNSESTSAESSSSSSPTSDARPSLTTSFTEVVSTINGKVTTIVTPVATLDAETSTTLTSSNRNAIIAGGTVAGLALVILCLLAIFLYRRRQKRKLDQSHRYLPTPRSVMLAGEDDFDLAGPSQPRRGLGIFGSHGKTNGTDDYRDLGSDSGRDVNSPVMHELPSEPPPRLLRPVASKTGSYFQEAVWPPPDEGSRLVDPLMAASNVDLHSIVDEVMGPDGQNQSCRSFASAEASSSTSPPRPSRLRGGAVDSVSFFTESGTPTDVAPRIPVRHGESPTMSSVESAFEPQRHVRDWSTDSATGLLANTDRDTIASRRYSGGSPATYGSTGLWLPPGAGRTTSPTSPLRIVTEPQQSLFSASSPSSPSSSRAREKTSEASQERRRSSLAVVNPNPIPETETGTTTEEDGDRSMTSSPSVYSQPVTLSTSTSIQRLRRLAGMDTPYASGPGTGTGGHTPYPDESPVERRSIPPSLAHAWLLDIEDEGEGGLPTPRPGPEARFRDEIPPRYDMILRDSEGDSDDEGVVTRTRTL